MRLQDQFVGREVHVVFVQGTITGTLEAVGDDGSLLVRQGPAPVWIPLGQVRYVMLVDVKPADVWEPDR